MATPSSSTRRMTRSQTLASAAVSASATNTNNSLSSKKFEESSGKKNMTKSRIRAPNQQQQDRSALIDITNDSPIVGLATGGNLDTPSSEMSRKRFGSQSKQYSRTPGSGEALLRGQVKTLLQKVEEEAELSKITLENRQVFNLQGLLVVNSPSINLAAPTPANTPQVLNFSVNSVDGLPPPITPSPVAETFLIQKMMLTEMAMHEEKEPKVEDFVSENNHPITIRSLLLDFSEKSDKSDSSSVGGSSILTYQGDTESKEKTNSTDDDDAASIWSIQVNASSTRDDEERIEGDDSAKEEGNDDSYCYEEDEEEGQYFGGNNDDVMLLLDEMCEGMSKISFKEGVAKFTGKHVRFVYNSDDELHGEEEVIACGEHESTPCSRGEMLHLKGLPTPKGKHIRFPQEEESEDEDKKEDN